MGTAIRRIRLSDEHWQALADLADKVVPDQEVAKSTKPGYTRIVPMFRMVADGKLIVVRPEELGKPLTD